MATDMNILAQVRDNTSVDDAPQGTLKIPMINNRRELLVAQGLPERTELVRQGASWVFVHSTATAAVTALPTTTAVLTIFNNEASTGKVYIVDAVGAVVTVASAAAGGMTIAGLLNKGATTIPNSVATSAVVSTLSGRTYGGNAKFKTAHTVTDDGWWPIGGEGSGAANTTLGSSVMFPVNGAIIIPPAGMFSLVMVGVNTTLVGKLVLMWHEVQIPYSY